MPEDVQENNHLYVIGIGPGSADLIAPRAYQALEKAKTIVGYNRYLELLPQELLEHKNIISRGMRQEKERCNLAIANALQGEETCIVCSGDAGIYAMAGLVLEMLEQQELLDKIALEIIPGIPALCACAALLGAPLMHDFAAISLSDLLTPWEKIKQRLALASEADFVIILYNPKSKGRPNYLKEALKIIAKFRSPNCPVGLVREAYRAKQWVGLFELKDFPVELADMLSLVIVGNSESRKVGQYMLTPRGYQL